LRWRVQVKKKRTALSRLVVIEACFTGLGLCAEQLPVAGGAESKPSGTATLFVVAVVGGSRAAETRVARHGQTGFAADFPRSTNMELLSDFGPSPDTAALAVAHERRRIGQDLHDSVASQLVNILSSLDIRT
jgi:signal transduction histidine kinase